MDFWIIIFIVKKQSFPSLRSWENCSHLAGRLHPGSCRLMPWKDLYTCETVGYLSARATHMWFALMAQLILEIEFLSPGNTFQSRAYTSKPSYLCTLFVMCEMLGFHRVLLGSWSWKIFLPSLVAPCLSWVCKLQLSNESHQKSERTAELWGCDQNYSSII